MKKVISKLAVCIVVFVITLFVSSSIYNQGNKELTTNMAQATLPLVHITTKGIAYNYLHGLRQEMDGSFFRDTITPLGDGRTLGFVIDKYDNEISDITFEVRSIDGARLVEKTKVSDYKETDDRIQATVTIKDLIETGVEYNWILMVKIQNETVRYYTRIIDSEGYNTYEKLLFVREFHDKTFDKERAKDLVTYLEPNSKGDNTTLSHVDIHSSLKQITWADLNVSQISKPQIVISEIESQNASIRMHYRVQTKEGKKTDQYNVVEFFRIRHTPDRTYLLDYERSMNQIFDPAADVYGGSKIMLGIRDSNVQMMESDGGSNLAFVNENQLFCYHAADKKIAYLFSFYDGDDPRSNYDNHDIKILNVDETENVRFMVYGYMNRGRHEGSIGVQVYEYNGMLNTVEELIFIPYNKAYATLKTDMEQLSYINKNSMLYLKWKDTIYGIHIMNHTCNVVVENLAEGRYKVSESNKMAVWQKEGSLYDGQELVLMNMTTGKQKSIKAAAGEILSPIGFMEEDMIYGIAREEDIVTDSAGNTVFPMYCLRIENETEGVLMEYREENVYVTAGKVTGNQIILSRVEKGEEGGYVPIKDDQIMNAEKEVVKRNTIETAVTEKYEKLTQIALKASISADTLIHQTPREVFVEEGREVRISQYEQEDGRRYYVYGKYGIENTYTNEKSAVNHADEISGVVINKEGYYVWQKGNRSLSNQIMAIHGEMMSEDRSSLAVCLDSLLAYEGVVRNSKYLLERGGSVLSILKDSLPDVEVLDLTGCTLDAVLYYVNQDIPVLALLRDGSAVLLVGFNEKNTVIMNPETGTVYKMGMNDSREWFEQNGNCFLTYIRNRD